MRALATIAIAAVAATGLAQIQFDEITKRNMSPRWGTVLIGNQGNFAQPCNLAVTSYEQWCEVWPYVAGPYYQRGMEVPRFIDWNTEQIVLVSLGNVGTQGYGMYVENIRQVSSFNFAIDFVVSAPNVQVGANLGYQRTSYQSFSFGYGTSPFMAIRVPRYYGIPQFNYRYYQPPSYVIRTGCGCNHCGGHGNKVWMFGKGGVLIPYTPPGQEDKNKNGG